MCTQTRYLLSLHSKFKVSYMYYCLMRSETFSCKKTKLECFFCVLRVRHNLIDLSCKQHENQKEKGKPLKCRMKEFCIQKRRKRGFGQIEFSCKTEWREKNVNDWSKSDSSHWKRAAFSSTLRLCSGDSNGTWRRSDSRLQTLPALCCHECLITTRPTVHQHVRRLLCSFWGQCWKKMQSKTMENIKMYVW